MLEKKKAITVLIFNDSGDLLLQLRAAHDDSFPAHWDFSVGGGIDADEEPETSAKRELMEELGVQGLALTHVRHETFRYPAWGDGHPREVENFIYKTRYEGPFAPNPKEVTEVRFFKLSEIEEMATSGGKLHPELVLALKQGIIAEAAR